MGTGDGAPLFHSPLGESDLSFDDQSLLDGPWSEDLEELQDVDSFFAQVPQCSNEIATSSGNSILIR